MMKLSAISYQLSAGVSLSALHRAALRCALSILMILAALPLVADSPLAMRVAVLPTAITADGTVMTVEVQLAPSDRGRIGHQARMRVKLTKGTKTTAHILQDVDFDEQGITQLEYSWPPGGYELSLTIESLRGTAQGLWIGHIEVPGSLDQAATPAAPEPKVETSRVETGAPAATSLPEAGAAAVVAAPVVASAGAGPKSPATPTENAAVTAPPKPEQAPEMIPPTPEPVAPSPAAESLLKPPPAAEPTAIPQPEDDGPPPKPGAKETAKVSGPVYALVLDIDPSDFEIADRVANLRASIDRRAENVTPVLIQAGDSDPTIAVSRALEVLQPHSKFRAIVVITDARRKASRSAWKKTSATVQNTEIPIFVIGLWNDEFDPGTRKQFKRLATESGGRSYVLQPAESPTRALEMLDDKLLAVSD